MGARAAARTMYEEAVGAVRAGASVEAPTVVQCIANSGACCLKVEDSPLALALHEEAAAMARQVLGEAHPTTQEVARQLARARKKVATGPPGACAIGILVGIGGRPELNGKVGFVVGFGDGRYRVRLQGSAASDKPLGIKPTNLALAPGTAMIVEGLISQPEWNGKRLLVVDADQGRYRLLVKGRARLLGVKLDCCRLESLVKQERELH